MRPAAIVCILVLSCLATAAVADPPNYQRYVIGERSLGMAGAYTAAVDDSMALYYNPGALGFADSTAVAASKSIYAADFRMIRDGFVPDFEEGYDAKDLDRITDLTWPSTLTFMTSFGKPKKGERRFKVRHAIGFAMLVPYQEEYSFRVKRQGEGIADTETFYLSESYRTLWTGVGYGVRPARRWGFGLAAFFSNYRYHRRFDSNHFDLPEGEDACGPDGCGELRATESILKLKVNSIIIRAGTLFRPHEQWRIGLAATAPSILLRPISEGSLDQTLGVASTTDPTAIASRMYTDDYRLDVAGYEPAAIRLGGAFIVPEKFTVDIDVNFHFPVSYRRIAGDAVARRLERDPTASPEWFDKGIVRRIERRPVCNVNLGTEFLFQHGWTTRTGLFSDFSSAPDVVPSDEPQLTRVNRIGGTLSVGHRGDDHDVTVGVIGTYGIGEASVYHPPKARGADEAAFQPAAYNDRTIFVFISGAGQVVQRKAEEWWKKIVD